MATAELRVADVGRAELTVVARELCRKGLTAFLRIAGIDRARVLVVADDELPEARSELALVVDRAVAEDVDARLPVVGSGRLAEGRFALADVLALQLGKAGRARGFRRALALARHAGRLRDALVGGAETVGAVGSTLVNAAGVGIAAILRARIQVVAIARRRGAGPGRRIAGLDRAEVAVVGAVERHAFADAEIARVTRRTAQTVVARLRGRLRGEQQGRNGKELKASGADGHVVARRGRAYRDGGAYGEPHAPPRAGAMTGRSPRKRSTVRRIARAAVSIALAYYGACAAGLLYLRVGPPLLTAVQIQRCLEALFSGRIPEHRMQRVPLASISPHLPHAVIAAEDTRFFEHHGIDLQGLSEAVQDNLRRGRLWRGGSTITQQLVKNLFLTTHGSLLRKAVELPLALLAELLLSKQRILELYLNVVEWGPSVYGAEAAARHHYRISAAQLDREQAARLAACLPDPRRRTPQRMSRYASTILRRMTALGW